MRRFSGKVVVLLVAVAFVAVFGLVAARAMDIAFHHQSGNNRELTVTFPASINNAPNAAGAFSIDIAFVPRLPYDAMASHEEHW
jgi:hypothetical protein